MVWAAVAVTLTAASIYEGEKATEAREESARIEREKFALQQKQADIRNIRAMRQQIRQARAARASIVNVAASTGTAGSTGALGGAASVESQLGGAISTFQQERDFGSELTRLATEGSVFEQKAGAAAGRSAQWGGLANLGFTAATKKGAFE